MKFLFGTALNNFSPALIVTGHRTCRSALPLHTVNQQRGLHGKAEALLKPESCLHLQTCNIRKVYPDPFDKDPEYFLP